MSGLLSAAAAVIIIVCIFMVLVMRRQRRIFAESRHLEMEHAMEQDAMRRASAKLKYTNSHRKRAESGNEVENDEQDPLRDLFGMEVPTDFRPGKKKKKSS